MSRRGGVRPGNLVTTGLGIVYYGIQNPTAHGPEAHWKGKRFARQGTVYLVIQSYERCPRWGNIDLLLVIDEGGRLAHLESSDVAPARRVNT